MATSRRPRIPSAGSSSDGLSSLLIFPIASLGRLPARKYSVQALLDHLRRLPRRRRVVEREQQLLRRARQHRLPRGTDQPGLLEQPRVDVPEPGPGVEGQRVGLAVEGGAAAGVVGEVAHRHAQAAVMHVDPLFLLGAPKRDEEDIGPGGTNAVGNIVVIQLQQ